MTACAAGEERQPPFEPGQQLFWREHLRPGGSQLDRQRQSIEPPANRRDVRGVSVGQGEVGPFRLRALDEQAHRLIAAQHHPVGVTFRGQRQRVDREHAFAVDA